MADIPSTLPDNWYIDQNIKPTSHYERTLWKEYQVQSKEIWGVIIDTKNWILKVVKKAEIKSEAKKETKELNEDIFRRVIVELTPQEIDFIWGNMVAIFKWNKLIRYEIWNDIIINVEKIDINNDFNTLLSKKVSWVYFERLENWEIIFHRWKDKPYTQNDNKFHKAFYIDFRRFKEPISK